MWLICCVGASIIYTTWSYMLSIFDKQPLETLSGVIIETLWGTSGVSFIGYAIQNSVRAFTSAKFGIPEDKKGGEDDGDKRYYCPVCGCSYSVDNTGVFGNQPKE